jgi:hypothetical protein
MPSKVFQNDTGMLMHQPGLSSVGSYQMSGIPFATSSLTVPVNSAAPLRIQFPYVTKFVTVVNENTGTNVNMRVGFSVLGISGSGTNFFLLDNGESYTGEWRVEDIFLISNSTSQTSASVIAGLTPIPRGIPSFVSTGNNWSGSAGVG